jgi:hypothetical protein
MKDRRKASLMTTRPSILYLGFSALALISVSASAQSQPFALAAKAFQPVVTEKCGTNSVMTGVTKEGLQVNGSIAVINGNLAVFCPGARHTWKGTIAFGGYTFASEASNPLVFKVTQSDGYVYVSGKGVVKNSDGMSIRLGEGNEKVQTDMIPVQGAVVPLPQRNGPDTTVVSAIPQPTLQPSGSTGPAYVANGVSNFPGQSTGAREKPADGSPSLATAAPAQAPAPSASFSVYEEQSRSVQPQPTSVVASQAPQLVATSLVRPVEESNTPLIVGGIGAGFLVLGGVFSYLALSSYSATEQQYDPSKEKQGDRFAVLQVVSYGIGAAGIVTGLLLRRGNELERRKAHLSYAASIVPLVNSQVVGATVHVTY